MGMPVVVEIAAPQSPKVSAALEEVFHYFMLVDERFSTYKTTSEIARINRGEIAQGKWSGEM